MTSADLPAPVADAAADSDCYHCGLPIPPDTQHYVQIDGRRRRMCCIGCEAVAQQWAWGLRCAAFNRGFKTKFHRVLLA